MLTIENKGWLSTTLTGLYLGAGLGVGMKLASLVLGWVAALVGALK